ncbi:hypothetical protein ACVWY3_000704 [Bradyrhizobium sp. USDA 4486]
MGQHQHDTDKLARMERLCRGAVLPLERPA